ncbi:hypothetical protein [Massilia glaciei]|uniref:hypothetical protein n=1 Tax=Massilia glaciei TaxID=1524097 RepID=UPI0015E82060|nr:hypothetical protein [Massilia glaciei]
MGKGYFVYALVVALVTTVLSWSSMAGSTKKPGAGSAWSARSGGGGFGGGGGGHK